MNMRDYPTLHLDKNICLTLIIDIPTVFYSWFLKNVIVSLLREICKAVSNICLILNSMFFNRFHISLKLCWFVDICRVIITKDHTGSKENRNQHGEHLLLIDQPKMALSNNNIVQTTEKSMIPDKETIIMIPTVENSMTQDKENCQVYIKQGSLFPPI